VNGNAKPSAIAYGPPRPEDGPTHFKPRLNALLRSLRIDVSYERGAGDFLYYRNSDGREVEVLDLVGGYGALLLGHAHPALVTEAQRLLGAGVPFHAQGSRREPAARLARELSRRAGGDYCVVLGNSGTEAVEAALKHALLETDGRTFIALERGFHGKTLGALQATADATHREPFVLGALAGFRVVHVPANDIEALEAAFARCDDLAGFLFEPIQGEGGVRPISREFAQRAAELCAERDVPLIADECQTGLGRTGTFLACEQLGVQPDYVVLSKALGGGLAKISALLVRRERYCDGFDLKHSSTYADDDFSCTIALRVLELVDDEVLATCRRQGDRLLDGLQRLAGRYPDVIADVRGRGLLLAVEFRPLGRSTSFLLRFISAQEDLAYLAASFLLNAHRIRVSPTLSERLTLRIEPSALIGDRNLTRVLEALDDFCSRLSCADALGLTRHLVAGGGETAARARFIRSDPGLVAYDEPRFREQQRHAPLTRVAWLCHLVDADDLVSLEPAFAELSFQQREDYLAQFVSWSAPVVLSAVDVRSSAGGVVRLYPILLPFTSRWIKRGMDQRHFAQLQALVQQGVDLAHDLGCQVVSLGQYTSIATMNGTRLATRGMGVTTGNSYAVALAIEAIERAQRETGRRAEESVLVVAGAAGNIGQVCAEILAPRYRRTTLIGSTRLGSRQRLQALAATLPNTTTTTDLAAVGEGGVVIAALNAVDAPLAASDFAPNAIFCDLSVPASLPRGAAALRPDVLHLKGGIAALPFGEDLEIVDFPLPRGQTYGCMAEAILFGLEGVRDTTFTGALSPGQVRRVAAMAERHGFSLADYRRSCVLGSEREEVNYASTR
jgi:acetylornithine/succinyldiaminopimelate/putrescine aminotransferase/predicted amino acid dehydrogenase